MSRPGSAWWLLRHELRLMWAGTLASRRDGRRAPDRKTIAVWTVMVLALHGAAFAVIDLLPKVGGAASPQTHAAVGFIVLVTVLFMMASAMKASSEALFERGDFDLLLSSPLPTRSIMTVRMAVVVGRVAGIYLFFLAPLAHMGLALGRPRLLAIYPVVLALSALASVAAMLLTLGLVRLCGARAARMVAQVLGPLFGAALFIGAQLTNTALRAPALRAYEALRPWLGSASPVGYAASAVLGDPIAIALLSATALTALGAGTTLLHGYFARGVQLAAGSARVARAGRRSMGALRWRFGRGLVRTIVIKEWTSIARDPQLVSQVLLQTLYLVPLGAALFANSGPSLPATVTAMVFLCASLASSLTWIVVSAEDAPDLLASSPADPALVARAKLLAVLAPVLALAALPALWVALQHWLRGLVMLGTICMAIASSASIAFWFSRPAARAEFRARARGNALSGVFDLLTTSAWAATGYLLLHGLEQAAWTWYQSVGVIGTVLCALLFLGLARLWRGRTVRTLGS
jgi:ABC-2 type transport system permease protein